MPAETTMESLGFVESLGTGGEGSGMAGPGGTRVFYGKYRATVLSNEDPYGRCRLLLNVVDVYGPNVSSWAMPCLPYAGLQLGAYIVPPPGAGVWVEFEQGDPDYPIWTGCWWGLPDAPLAARAVPPGAPVFMVTSVKQGTIAISDLPLPTLGLKEGGVVLSAGPQCFIAIEPTGVTIVAPKVDITGVMAVNKTALIVTL